MYANGKAPCPQEHVFHLPAPSTLMPVLAKSAARCCDEFAVAVSVRYDPAQGRK